MGKVNFFLKEPGLDKESLVFLVYNFNKRRLKYSTGEYIHHKAWDFASKCPKDSLKYPHNLEISRRLEDYKFFIVNLLGDLKREKNEVTVDLLRLELDKQFKNSPKIESTESNVIVDYIDTYIKQCETGKRLTPKGKKYKDWTIKGYSTLKYHLNEYCSLKSKILNFDDITLDFYFDFLEYFHKLNSATNTIGKHIKNIKVIMSASFEEGKHNNLDFKKKRFRITTEETDAIYLTDDELDTIYNHDFSENKKLEKARDLFIIAARTGLRFADLTSLKEHNFFIKDKKHYISIRTKKTDSTVIIPLKKQVIEIFNKYNKKLPRAITNQKMNEYLKEIGKAVEFYTKISKSITKGGITVESQIPKHDLITTHTARRSFATNCSLAEVPKISIMKITGHKTERAFMKYIRMSEEENAIKMADHAYFKDDF